jgi:hypothetical protein
MKKIILSLALVTGLGTMHNTFGQTTFGVKAEANLSNLVVSKMADTNSKLGFGANVGGFANIEISKMFAVQPEVMFLLENSKVETSGVKNNIRTWGVQVPVYAMLQLPSTNTGRAYVGVGPYAGLGFNAKNTTADVDLYDKNGADKAYLKRFDLGLAATAGYEFSNRIQINASYKHGLLDQLDADSKNSTFTNQMITLGLGYRF